MPVMDTRTALAELLHLWDATACRHEETHRGGILWTICDGCGRKWADDQGGFQPYQDPQEVANARATLEAHPTVPWVAMDGSSGELPAAPTYSPADPRLVVDPKPQRPATPVERIASALETIAGVMTAEPPASGSTPMFRLGYDFGAGIEQVAFSIGQQIKRGMDAG